jgi:hypothetical protein
MLALTPTLLIERVASEERLNRLSVHRIGIIELSRSRQFFAACAFGSRA